MMSASLESDKTKGFELAGNKAACLLLHGFTGTPDEMRPMAEYLNQQGFHVSVPRLAGHGTTIEDFEQTSQYDWFESAYQALLGLEKLKLPIFVGGLSMGGLLSFMLASKKPELIRGLIIMATPFCLPGLLNKYFAPLMKPLSWRKIKPYYRKKQVPSRIKHLAYSIMPTQCISSLNELISEVKKVLPGITTPTLLVYSEKDPTAGIKHFDYAKQRLGSTEIVSLQLQRSGHIITKDFERDKVFEQATNFIKERICPT